MEILLHKGSFESKPHNSILSELQVKRKMDSASATLEPLFSFMARSLSMLDLAFNKLPGSAVIQRYIRSSHQNDPGRTILEIILIIFAVRTLLQSRTRADRTGKHFIQFSDKV